MMPLDRYLDLANELLERPLPELLAALKGGHDSLCVAVTLWPLVQMFTERPELIAPELAPRFPGFRQRIAEILTDAGFSLDAWECLTMLELGVYRYRPQVRPHETTKQGAITAH